MSQKTLKTLQGLIDKAAKMALGPDNYNKSNSQRSRMLSWLPIKEDIQFSTLKMAYKMLNSGVPEELSVKAPMNKKGRRIEQHKKFDQKPKWLNKDKLTRSTFWNRIYFYNTLPERITTLPTLNKLKKALKSYLMDPQHQTRS